MEDEKIEIDDTSANPDMEAELVPYSPHEEIASCFYALSAVDEMDSGIMSDADKRRIEQIKRYCLRIIHYHVKDLYTDLFEIKDQQKED